MKKTPENVTFIRGPLSYDDGQIAQLVEEGKTVLIGGLSIIGPQGYMVRTVLILQITSGPEPAVKGWSLYVDSFPERKHEELRHIDSLVAEPDELALPNTMVYLIAEVDPVLLDPNTDKEKLQEIVEYAVSFIHD